MDVDVGLGLRFGRRRRRFFDDRRVGLLFLSRRIGDGSFLLLTSRKQRGAH